VWFVVQLRGLSPASCNNHSASFDQRILQGIYVKSGRDAKAARHLLRSPTTWTIGEAAHARRSRCRALPKMVYVKLRCGLPRVRPAARLRRRAALLGGLRDADVENKVLRDLLKQNRGFRLRKVKHIAVR
jgi:hypothetical protein